MMNIKKIAIIAFSLLLLVACEESKKMPEDVVEDFINAVYNTKNISVMKENANDKMSTLIDHYRSISMIQRQIMEFSLDSDVTVEIKSVGGDFFRKSKKDTRVEVHIRGRHEGGIKADDRYFLVTWEENRWKVKNIGKS